MAKYKFDPLAQEKVFDSMFGAGEFNRSLASARSTGAEIGRLKRQKKEEEEQARILEAAKKEAAKKERERKAKEEKEKKTGKKETNLSKSIENQKFRAEQAGVSTEKEQSWLGKKLNLDPDNNLFFDALDILGRPINAVNAAIKPSIQIDKELNKQLKAGKITEDEYFEKLKEAKKDHSPLKDFVDGLTGKQQVSGADLMKEHGIENKVAQGVLGFASDAALDPLNLVGGALGKGVTLGLKATGKRLSKLPGADKVDDVIDSMFSGKKAKRQTMTGDSTDDLLDLEREAENARLYRQDKSQTDVAKAMLQGGADNGIKVGKIMEEPLVNPISKNPLVPDVVNGKNALNSVDVLGKRNPVSTTSSDILTSTKDQGIFVGPTNKWGTRQFDVESTVKEALKTTPDIKKASEKLRGNAKVQAAAKTLMESNGDLRKFAEENGISIPDLEGYMAHFITKEAKAWIDKTGGTVSDGGSYVGGNKKVLQRELKDSVDNANAAMRKTTGGEVQEFFNPDALVSTAGGQQRVINFIVKESVKNRVLGDARFAKELKQSSKARKGYEMVEVDGKRFEVTKGAKKVITNFERKTTDEGISNFMKGWDKITDTWKKTALFSAGFHIRNAFGNAWNMYVSGMNPVQLVSYQGKAAQHLDGIHARRVGKNTRTAAGEMDDRYDQFLQQGLKNTGSMADFAAKDAGDELMRDIRYKTKGSAGKLTHDLTEALQVKGAWNKTKALANAPFDASRRVGDASDEISRFALFNWAMDSGMSAKQAAAHVREVLFDYTDITEFERNAKRLLPFYTWMRKNAEFQVKSFIKDPAKYNKLNLMMENGYDASGFDEEIVPEWMREGMSIPIPGTDKFLSVNPPAADLSKLTDPGKMLLDSLHPLAKLPFEIGMNKNALTGAPIEEFEGQKGKLLGKEFNAPLGIGSGKQWEYGVKNLLAPVRNISGAMERQEAGGGIGETLAKAVGGEILKPYNEEKFQNNADWVEMNRLDDLIKKAKAEGTDVETIAELKKQGITNDPVEAEAISQLQEIGYDPKQVDMLMAMKKKVYNNDEEYALKVAKTLSDMGLPPEVIELITSDYLVY